MPSHLSCCQNEEHVNHLPWRRRGRVCLRWCSQARQCNTHLLLVLPAAAPPPQLRTCWCKQTASLLAIFLNLTYSSSILHCFKSHFPLSCCFILLGTPHVFALLRERMDVIKIQAFFPPFNSPADKCQMVPSKLPAAFGFWRPWVYFCRIILIFHYAMH